VPSTLSLLTLLDSELTNKLEIEADAALLAERMLASKQIIKNVFLVFGCEEVHVVKCYTDASFQTDNYDYRLPPVLCFASMEV